jgi:hypothetical protein
MRLALKKWDERVFRKAFPFLALKSALQPQVVFRS